MVLTKGVSGHWITFSGTLAEVRDALKNEGIPEHKVKGFHILTDNTTCVVLVHK